MHDSGMGNQDNPGRTTRGLGRLMVALSDAAFLTATVLKNVFRVLVSSSSQSSCKFWYLYELPRYKKGLNFNLF
jgi:hypothetical protein